MVQPTDSLRLQARDKPSSATVMKQEWSHLLFLHWEIAAEEIQKRLPEGLYVDTFEGKAYLGVVPFYMENIRPVFCPGIPGVSWFKELNFRTYVYDTEGRPGVWFFALECNQWIAVKMARTFFHLPYHHAKMSAELSKKSLTYISQRKGDELVQKYIYPAQGHQARVSEVGTLEFFLLERYRLYSAGKKNQLFSGLVHHQPYQYAPVECETYSTRLFSLCGFDEPTTAPVSAMVANRVKVDIHPLERLR